MCCAECYFNTYLEIVGNGDDSLRHMVSVVRDKPNVVGEPVILRGDSMSAIIPVKTCGGARDP